MTRPLTPLLLVLACALPAAAKEAKLTGFDALGRVGRKVDLKAKLETKGMLGIDPDVKGASLDFFVMAKDGAELKKPMFLGTGKTNDDGVATVDWKPDEAGRYTCEARVRRGSEHTAAPAQLLVAVPAEGRPILLVQIDGTVSKATNVKMFSGTENDEIQAEVGSKEMLALLAEHHQLVYLTDLEVAFTNKFREWLALRELPPAPVFFWELFERSLSHKTYVSKLVDRLHKGFPALKAGIGGKGDDGRAFVENGLVGIVIADEEDKGLPDTVAQAKTWQVAFAHVLQAHRAEGLLKKLAAGGADAAQAQLQLGLLGPAGVGYVHRFLDDADLNLATVAIQVANELRAQDTFFRALDLSNANRARNALIAAWRYGQLGVVRRLYADADAAKKAAIPAFSRVELLSRSEPEPGRVVYKLKLFEGEGKETERTVVCLEQEDKSWRIGD
ncbi:MAG: hypothetical protein AB7N76_33550 [Planctomycetota bacterium]